MAFLGHKSSVQVTLIQEIALIETLRSGRTLVSMAGIGDMAEGTGFLQWLFFFKVAIQF